MRQQGGVLVGSEEIAGLLNNLDTAYLLDSAAFRWAKERIVSDFTNRRVRPASHSGKSYPDNPAKLRALLHKIMSERPAPLPDDLFPSGAIRALVAPHIGIDVGQKAYAHVYENEFRGQYT